MTLTLPRNEYIDDYFIDWLLDEIQYEIFKYINDQKLDVFNDIINKNEIFEKNVYNQNVQFDVRKAILISLNNLTYRKINNVYIIEIKNTVFPNYKVNLDIICKLLNYGNSQIKGFPIYSKVFNHIKSNIIEYYEQYLDE